MYKKTELELSPRPLLAIAVAVIKTWREDGKPKGDDMQLWFDIVNHYYNKDHAKSGKPTITF